MIRGDMESADPTQRTPAAPGLDEAIVDVEFEVVAGDLLDAGRALTAGKRAPMLPHALVFTAIGAAFWWLGNPFGGALMIVFAILMLANPRMGFLDRWFVKRMPGNRIGSRWRIWAGSGGIGYSSAGVTGHIAWSAVQTFIVRQGSVVVMGEHNSALVTVPVRAMTPWQVAALTELVRTNAPGASILD